MALDENIKILAVNRKARFHYSVTETLECGIELKGTEVKSMRGAGFSFSDSYARINNDELWLFGFHISQYPFGNRFNHDPDRPRKLLVHKEELKRLKRKIDEKGLTLVPLKFYLKRGLVKLEIGICKGKKLFDKREDIKKRDHKRDAERDFRGKY
ncbi:MAG: SsrA-binding protein SmpB [Spirochaetes bacterium]|nr:SsrA-binding protein SmpB [Spirochaetota bacterium]